MHISKVKRISLAVCFALMPMASQAAGLGKLTVVSGLGEPLNAEVELLSTTKEELASLTAQLAPSEVFADQGVERAAILSAIRVEVGKRPDGTPILHLTSSQPINDPFLDMLIQVEWSSGRLLREYTALLDPPGYGDRSGSTATATLPSAGAAPQAEVVPGAPSEALPRKGKGRKATAPAGAEAPIAANPEDHVVQKGDTLHAIAVQNQVDGVSLEQMLVGLYRANKEVFVGNNMNRLKVGQIIHVPPQEELQAITKAEAAKEIRVQTADWNAYRNKLAGMVAESAPAQEQPASQTASGKITAPAEDKSAPPAPGPRDVVKLSKSESGAAGKGGAADVSGRISALQEEATAREKALKEADARASTLEKQLQDMQKLLEIKNKSLADAQKNAAAPAAPAPAAPEAAKPTTAPAAPTPPPAAQPEPPKPAAEAVPAKPAEKPAAKLQEKKPRKIVRPQPPKEEPGLADTLFNDPLLLAGAGGGLLALIGGIWFYLRNKRRKGLDSFEQGILTTGGLKPNTVFGNTAGGTVDTGNTSFLTDFGQGATTGMIDTNDVDPIAEAEVYMAYGRDVQAEEILKDALSKEPKRHELHLKLLEIYANRKETTAFETLAGELYATLGATDPVWTKVAEMGHKLEPDNPLYGDGAAHAAKAEPSAPDFDATMIQQAPAVPVEELDLSLGGEEDTLDFSLDEASAPAAAAEPVTESNTLDFDIGGLELPAEAPAPAAEESLPDLDVSVVDLEFPAAPSLEPPAEQQSAGLDFQLDLPEPAAAENAQLDVADLGVGDLPSLEESPVAAEAPAAPAEQAADLSLDFPELNMAEAAPKQAAAPAAEAMVDLSLPDLELPSLETGETAAPTPVEQQPAQQAAEMDFDLSALEAEPAVESEISLELPALENEPAAPETKPESVVAAQETEPAVLDIDLGGFELPEMPAEPEQTVVLELPAEEPAAEAKPEEAPQEEVGGLDFNFDIDLGETEQKAAPSEAAPAAVTELPDLDLSGISLDVAEEEAAPAAAPEEVSLSAAESPDVDTKLDLVTAYIDMGDQEGARELLEEVLKEGGPMQREKAQKLMAGMG